MPDLLPSMLQFNLRKCFWVLSALSVLFAIATPKIRSWPIEVQIGFAWHALVVIGSLFTLVLGYLCRRRVIEQHCGKVLVISYPPNFEKSKKIFAVMAVIQILAASPMFASFLYMPARTASGGLRVPYTASVPILGYFSAALLGVFLAMILLNLLSGQRQMCSEFGENGVIRGAISFTPWTQLKTYDWPFGTNEIALIGKHWRCSVPANEEDREEIERLLKAKIKGSG